MKKIFLIIIKILIAIFVYINVNAEIDEVLIPGSAIRVRVIANSNSIHDQSMKMKVKTYIERNLSVKLLNVSNVEDARKIIDNEMDTLNDEINHLFKDNSYDMDFLIHFGDNYFPEKEYKGVYYEAGSYESLVVTIGNGEGDNWWCVLFPPLCLLDASDNHTSDVEYQFFVQKMIAKIFS